MTDLSVTWSDERVELLKKLWSDGLSASQIASELGGVTRNAVIGKVHRLGLSGRGKTPAPAAQRPKGKPARGPSQPLALGLADGMEVLDAEPVRPIEILPVIEEPMREAVVLPISERVTIMDLRESMCRWPLGDPTSTEFRFCGARSITGLPYCNLHCEVAYQPTADRKRDRKLMRA